MLRPLLLGTFCGTIALTPAFAAAPLAGLWAISRNHVQIRIAPCGPVYCGRMVSADRLRQNPQIRDKMNRDPRLRARPIGGLVVLSGFTGGPTKWTGGSVYNPDDGRTYRSEMTMVADNTLKVTGCVIKPLCKSQTLTRVR